MASKGRREIFIHVEKEEKKDILNQFHEESGFHTNREKRRVLNKNNKVS